MFSIIRFTTLVLTRVCFLVRSWHPSKMKLLVQGRVVKVWNIAGITQVNGIPSNGWTGSQSNITSHSSHYGGMGPAK